MATENIITCERCDNEHDGIFGTGRFCSKSCANTRIHSTLTKSKIRKSVTIQHEFRPKRYRLCKLQECDDKIEINMETRGRRYCSKVCEKIGKGVLCSIAARKRKISKRSKNEILFAELCKNEFANVLNNKPIFNGWDADVILSDYKVAVLWNGVWHYKKITKKHSVKQVKNRDKIKLDEITKVGYYPYIIKDMGKYDEIFVNKEFISFCQWLRTQTGQRVAS